MYPQDEFYADCIKIKEDLDKIFGEKKEKISFDISRKIQNKMLITLIEMKERMMKSSKDVYTEKASMIFVNVLENTKAFIESKKAEIESEQKLLAAVTEEEIKKYSFEFNVNNEFATRHLFIIYEFTKRVEEDLNKDERNEPQKSRKWFNIFRKQSR